MLVFLSTCDGVEFHHQLLQDAYEAATGGSLLSCPLFMLHGNLSQVRAESRVLAISLAAATTRRHTFDAI